MKTAGRENPNCWAAKLSNRATGAEGQNRSCSIKWATKVKKFSRGDIFFLTFPFIEQIRSYRLCLNELLQFRVLGLGLFQDRINFKLVLTAVGRPAVQAPEIEAVSCGANTILVICFSAA